MRQAEVLTPFPKPGLRHYIERNPEAALPEKREARTAQGNPQPQMLSGMRLWTLFGYAGAWAGGRTTDEHVCAGPWCSRCS